jgi:hypothetical protein
MAQTLSRPPHSRPLARSEHLTAPHVADSPGTPSDTRAPGCPQSLRVTARLAILRISTGALVISRRLLRDPSAAQFGGTQLGYNFPATSSVPHLRPVRLSDPAAPLFFLIFPTSLGVDLTRLRTPASQPIREAPYGSVR